MCLFICFYLFSLLFSMVGLFVSFSSTFFPVWFVLFLFFFCLFICTYFRGFILYKRKGTIFLKPLENLNQHFSYPNLGPFQKSSWLNFERSNMDYQVTVDIIRVNRKKASVLLIFHRPCHWFLSWTVSSW